MSEVRFRRDGPGDSVGAFDAVKITKHEGDGVEWHVAGLYPWSRAMLSAYFDEALRRGDNPSVLRIAGRAPAGYRYVAQFRSDAVWFCEQAALYFATDGVVSELIG